MTTYLVTGASGQLGQLVVDHLSTLVPAGDIIALVRSEDAAKAYADKGITTRKGDYEDVDSLKAAFDGVDRLLLVSSSEVGKRATQHENVLSAAKAAGVGFIAYTSILNAETGGMALAEEHLVTEAALRDSGIPHTLLRNGWYSENIAGRRRNRSAWASISARRAMDGLQRPRARISLKRRQSCWPVKGTRAKPMSLAATRIST